MLLKYILYGVQIYWKKRKILHRKRFQLPQNLVWDTNMAAVKLFWGNNMVDVTSREKGIHVYNAEKVDLFTK